MTVNRIFDPDRDTMDALVEVLCALLVDKPGEQNPPPSEPCIPGEHE